MFQKGDYVVYGYSGVCRVEEITGMDVPGTRDKRDYYVLQPVQSSASKVYAPVDGKKTIRAIMTLDEAQKLINDIPDILPMEIQSDKYREERYKEAMRACDCSQWVSMIKTLYIRRILRMEKGKQSTAMDNRYLKAVEEHLFTELSLAMDKEISEMEKYISAEIEKYLG